MAKLGTVELIVDVNNELVLGLTPDGHPQIWLLYDPEPWPPDSVPEREINLWVRRANVFTSQQAAIDHLNALKGEAVAWRKYDPIFPELWIGIDSRGYRWLMEPAPVDAPGAGG